MSTSDLSKADRKPNNFLKAAFIFSFVLLAGTILIAGEMNIFLRIAGMTVFLLLGIIIYRMVWTDVELKPLPKGLRWLDKLGPYLSFLPIL